MLRHDKTIQLIELARRLASSAEGLTLDEMAAFSSVDRRTAERLRDAIAIVFPALEEIWEAPYKRYRIPGGLDGFAQTPTTEELLELSSAAVAHKAAGATTRAAALERLERKIRSAMRREVLRRVATDVEALARAELIAVQAGPGPLHDDGLVADLRRALLAMRRVRFIYDSGSSPGEVREVIPYGLLFGRRGYLVGADPGRAAPKSFRLDRIRELGITEVAGAAPPDFDLAAYGGRSFGVFQGDLEDVRLRFRPEAADDALSWRFHTQQHIELEANGAVVVSFTSSGMLELAWHLMTWRDAVEVLAPPSLQEALLGELQRGLAHHGRGTSRPVAPRP